MKGRYRYRNKKNSDDKFRRTGQSTVLKSGYTVDQTWKGLKKAWLGLNTVQPSEQDIFNVINQIHLYTPKIILMNI
jgi:hypothetical protein